MARSKAANTAQLGEWTVFVGGPFSAALKFNDAREIVGFDEELRAKFERVYAFLRAHDAGILSSHLAESFGSDVHESTLVQRDNAWLAACDLYLAVLPFGGAEPYRSDGTFVEIGMAIALRRPCLLLVEQQTSAAWSFYVRNLGAEPLVTLIHYDSGEARWLQEAQALIAQTGRAIDRRPHIEDPHTLNSLVLGGVAGHRVHVRGSTLLTPAGALSMRYDGSLRALCDIVAPAAVHAKNAVAVGGGAGELAVALLQATNARVSVIEPNAVTRAALADNLNREGFATRTAIHDTPARIGAFDLLAFHAPPLTPEGGGPFAAYRTQLIEALRLSLPLASPDAEIYLAVTSFSQASDVVEASANAGWTLQRVSPSSRETADSRIGLWRGVRIQT